MIKSVECSCFNPSMSLAFLHAVSRPNFKQAYQILHHISSQSGPRLTKLSFPILLGLFIEAHMTLWCSLPSRTMAMCLGKLSLHIRDKTEIGNVAILMIKMLLTQCMHEIHRLLLRHSMLKLSSFLIRVSLANSHSCRGVPATHATYTAAAWYSTQWSSCNFRAAAKS